MRREFNLKINFVSCVVAVAMSFLQLVRDKVFEAKDLMLYRGCGV